MVGCFVMDSIDRKGGLAVMWNDECDVVIQSFSANHVKMLVKGRIRTESGLRVSIVILNLIRDIARGTFCGRLRVV